MTKENVDGNCSELFAKNCGMRETYFDLEEITMARRDLTLAKIQKRRSKNNDQSKKRNLILVDLPETDELEIQKPETPTTPGRKARFPKETINLFQMMPDEFAEAQNAIEVYQMEERQVEVYADSLESFLGYDSLIRLLNKFYCNRVAYYRSEKGGSLSLEEARKAVYKQNITDEQAIELFQKLMRASSEHIGFWHLMELNDHSPAMAQNIWEMIKREATREFESGHRAAAVFDPADYMTDAWNRASYLGLRESLCEEWQPKGGIELSMIDAIAQAWLQLQFWTTESVKRGRTEPRRENHEFYEWKRWNKQANPKQWGEGHWDVPLVSEQSALEHATQMADRWQRMYFRAIRNLRDWRRYTPQVTINNPQQVNIANDGGQQINVSKVDETETKKINP